MNRYRLHWRARRGAVIRDRPDVHAPDRGWLRPGDSWWGDPCLGTPTTIAGFGSSPVWIDGYCGYVWSGMLTEVAQGVPCSSSK